MMIRQKVISGLNIDFSSKWCLELLIKVGWCLTKVDNLDPNPINVGLLIHVCISLFMLENYSLFYACTYLLFHVHAFNKELQYHIIDLLLANMDEFLFHLARNSFVV